MNSPLRLCALFLTGTALLAVVRAESARLPDPSPPVTDRMVKMDPVEARSDRAKDEFYKANRSSIGTKTDTALIDLPQSLTVVTQQQMQDQQMLSIGDVVRYVPGITAHQGENNRDQVIFRGNSSSADFFVNGMRDDMQYHRDLYNLDRVEVLRGPNAMNFGRGGGGGIINRATKEADFSVLRETTLQFGSFDQNRATLDVNQPFSKSAALRVNGLYENSGSFRESVRRQRQGINPTATFRPSRQTKVTLGYEYLRDRRTADRGITSFQGLPADVPVETYYGNPDDSPVKSTVHLLTGAIEHRTAGGLTVRNRTLVADYDRFYQNYVPGAVNAAQTSVVVTAYNSAAQRRNLFNQTDLVVDATAGAVRHKLVGGVEVGRQLTDNFRQTGFFNNAATSLAVPYRSPTLATPVVFRQNTTDAKNHLQTDLAAVYVQDQLELNRHWQGVVGLRVDSFDLHYHNKRNGDSLRRRDTLVSPRAGLIYKPGASTALYGNYGVSHLPSSGDQFASLTTITQQMKPEQFRNFELGAKFDLRRDIFLTTAIYRLDRTNTRATDPNDPARIVQTGRQRTNGFEIGLNGSITQAWTASLGYAWQDAFIRSATAAARSGATVAQVPRHNFSLWNKVVILPKLSVGMGLIRRSAMFASIDNTVTLPGYTRLDAAVFYSISERWRVQLNVENLLDRKYHVNADGNTNISPGSPRAIALGLALRL